MSRFIRRRSFAVVAERAVRSVNQYVDGGITAGGDGKPRISAVMVTLLLPLLVLLVYAVRTMVGGSTAWESVLFSRYYVQLFALFTIGIPTFRALWREYDEWGFTIVLILGLVTGIVAGELSPGSESSFCFAGKSMLYGSSPATIPVVFRCTSILWAIPASFLFWWGLLFRRRRMA